MAIYANTNVSSLNAQRQMTNATSALDVAFQRLSSGERINSAKDDAAGLQISSRLQSQIAGLNQGNRNANDGISLAQTLEGAIDEVSGMFQRMRQLAVQAANGSNTDADRAALQLELRQLGKEINRISKDTTFGGRTIMDGSFNAVIQVGANTNQTISFTVTAISSFDGSSVNVNSFAVSDIAAVASDISGTIAGLGASTAFANASSLSFTSVDKAQSMLAAVDAMIGAIDAKRTEMGAVQNRLGATIRNQSNIAENLSAARSRIKDADFAAETAALTKAQILQQASSTILSQSNQRPQGALALLQG
ncbi:MAG: flagellin [Rheinheimera sp.]|nr:flagellin [Gammaproteobacteria bacterium]MDZ7904007.1 flagellin [Rheinheimera sp.]